MTGCGMGTFPEFFPWVDVNSESLEGPSEKPDKESTEVHPGEPETFLMGVSERLVWEQGEPTAVFTLYEPSPACIRQPLSRP